MYRCSLCAVTVQSVRRLETHVTTEHASVPKPYRCAFCDKHFARYSSQKRHETEAHSSQTLDTVPHDSSSSSSSSSSATTSIMCSERLFVYSLSQSQETVTEENFLTWSKWYQTQRGSMDPMLSDSTAAAIHQHIVGWEDWNWDFRDSDECLEQVAEYEQTYIHLSPATLATHIRHLWWYALYQHALKRATWQVCERLRHYSSTTMSQEHRERQNRISMSLIHPAEMIQWNNRIVAALRHEQQTVWDPLCTSFLLERPDRSRPEVDVWQPYRLSFMCWLELATRFTGIPLRTQASKELKIKPTQMIVSQAPDDNSEPWVAELIEEKGLYYRVLWHDKVGRATSHCIQPIPVGDALSFYWHFYLQFVRLPSPEGYVFTNTMGKRWHHISRDLKHYLKQTLDIPVEALEPNGRFIHASRTMGIAKYALLTGFDLNKMRGLALLLRHSLDTMQAYYSLWSQWYLGTQALVDFSQVMGLTLTPLFQQQTRALQTITASDIEQLATPPPVLQPHTLPHRPCPRCQRFAAVIPHPESSDTTPKWCISCGCQIFYLLDDPRWKPTWQDELMDSSKKRADDDIGSVAIEDREKTHTSPMKKRRAEKQE